jgi:phosphoglycerate-specific signal transduction histidine kinase
MITGNDPARVDLTLTVPLDVNLGEYRRENIVEFDYNEIVGNNEDDVNNVRSFSINLLIDNNLPFDVELTGSVVDYDGALVNQIISEEIIVGRTTGQTIEIKLTQEELIEFRENDVKNIILYTSAKTAGEYKEALEDDYLDISVSVRFRANIPSNIFE